MKKAEKETIVKTLKHTKTKRLKAVYDALARWDDNHDTKKKSWFWTGNGNRRDRERREAMYNFADALKIGAVTIHYTSHMTQSRAHTYWDDSLEIDGMDAAISFGDVRYLMTAIDEILDTRSRARKTL